MLRRQRHRGRGLAVERGEPVALFAAVIPMQKVVVVVASLLSGRRLIAGVATTILHTEGRVALPMDRA